MVPYLGDFSEDSTVYMPFNTFTSNDPSESATITNLADADVKVHKDGSVTQIVTDGATVAIDFDGVTGNHLITIDTSVHADYSTGSDYHVRIEGTTVDAGTVNAWVGHFSIQNRHAAGALRPTTAGRDLDVTATGAAGIDWGNVENPSTAVDLSATDIQLADTVTTLTGHTAQTGDNFARLGAPAGASVSADIAAVLTDTAEIGTAGAGLTAIPYNEDNDHGYHGPRGPGVYLNDAAANTNTTVGTDGTIGNPVSTIAAAKSIADATSMDRIYLVNDSAITLAVTMTDFEFVGIGGHDVTTRNSIALASQDVGNSAFYNVEITGIQGGTARAMYERCFFGTATLHAFAYRCGLTDASTGITLSSNDDNVFDGCFSAVPGNSAPILICSGANLDLSYRHGSGGVELKTLNATATVSIETDGQVIFNADCNVNAAVTMRGWMSYTDNTAGMNSLTILAIPQYFLEDGTATYDRTTDSLQALRDRGDSAWVTGGGTGLTALATGTAQSGTGSTIVLAAASTFADNELNGNVINIHTGTGAGQSRVIISNTNADDTCNVYPNWATNPDATSQYEIVQGSANVSAISLDGAAADNLEAAADGTGYNLGGGSIVAADVTAAVTVDTLSAGTITAASIATDAITADKIAAAAITDTEFTATGSGLSVIITDLDDIKGTGFAKDTHSLTDITTDVTGLNGDAMRGTDSAALASVCTEARLSELDAATAGKAANQIDIIQIDTTTDIPALIAALNDVSSADVLTQVNAALDTAIAELGVAQPTATPTLRTGLMLLYMALRNRLDVQTSGTDALEIHNDAGTQITQKLVTDDGTDYSEAKMG